MKQALVLLVAAAGAVTWWGAIFAITQRVGVFTGLYWSVATATTVGYGDVTARGTGGHLLAIADMLTAIPLLAAAFSSLHLDRVDERLRRHHKAIHDRLDRIEHGNDGSEAK